ncbi:MAG: non-ribosomal peptide synthetase, partial [Cyanothece sp. SIO1E1]|nr:non-ribosomal peptide synthetase [Cyanothece sp. SIO1E1]
MRLKLCWRRQGRSPRRSVVSSLSEQIARLSPAKQQLLLRQLQQRQSPTVERPHLIECQSRRSHTFPLSFAQQRLWFLDQLEPGSSAYNMPVALGLSGQLHIGALKQSLLEVVNRHESLRTTFSTQADQPIQVITPTPHYVLNIVDLRALSLAQRQVEARWLATQAAEMPFNLTTGPLLRVTLLKLAAFEHIILFTTHHIISDGWSVRVLTREIITLYAAFSNSKPNPLPELPIQYADFAVWQRQHLQGETLARQLHYWKKTLSHAPSRLELPTDHPRPAHQSFRAGRQPWQLSQFLTEALKTISQQEKSTLFITLLTIFKILLYRYTEQADILVGTPIANRNRTELEGLIGFFANTLVLRTVVTGNPTFREFLGQVRQVALNAYTHQDLPFEQLVDALQLERNLSHHPLFQVMFTLQHTPMADLHLPGLTVSALDESNRAAKFDLSCLAWEIEAGLEGLLEYNADLFEAATIARMGQHFQSLIEG